MKAYLQIMFISCLGLPIQGHAIDCGTQGSVYAIKEQDALQWIYKKLQQMENNGEIIRHQEKLKARAIFSLEHPTPVQGLKPTEKPRTFEKDLTITVSSDITDAEGKLIHKAGTRVNPLSQHICHKTLIFLDGDNPKQLQWALNQYQQSQGLVKLVLVNGPVLALMKTLEIPLYFDQAGRLVQYFNIEQIPAMVSQAKDKLKIMEIKL
jgi:conjugal transfer pilus assembly protein TraW